MRVVRALPRPVRTLDHVWIPLSDGTRLGARIWLPEDADQDPVPAILEYLPYRKGDGTAVRDAVRHPYVAGHGYAVVRVDLRGSGESDGLLHDEYLPQELADGQQVLRWLAAQPWCTGDVGMFGISWGGFNGLQLAALRPPELKAVISLCSTDDRYADDVHYRGGCVLALDMLLWGTAMSSFNATPPDPAVAGPGWRDAWLRRMADVEPYVHDWMRHQARDDYWRHGSVAEDLSAIACPVYAIGGWADGYSDAVLRLLAGLRGPRLGLIGPWGHGFPDDATPGPAIGFLQECLRWWDRWLKGVETGIMDEPALRAWMQEPVRPAPSHAVRPGRWVGERAWPSPRVRTVRRWLGPSTIVDRPHEGCERVAVGTDLLCGLDGGAWCADGGAADAAVDQRADDGRAASFDSAPLGHRVELLGHPRVVLELAADRPVAQVAVRLCDVAPDGTSLLVTRGVLNLTHRDGHARPAPLEPGRRYEIDLRLDAIAQAIPAGHRLRLAVSPAYWPWLWPAPEPVTLSLWPAGCRLELPVREPQADDARIAFAEPEGTAPPRVEAVAPADDGRRLTVDYATGAAELTFGWDAGGVTRLVDAGVASGWTSQTTFSIVRDDPRSARVVCRCTGELERAGWRGRAEVTSTMEADGDRFRIVTELRALEDGASVLERRWAFETPRLLA